MRLQDLPVCPPDAGGGGRHMYVLSQSALPGSFLNFLNFRAGGSQILMYAWQVLYPLDSSPSSLSV